MEDVAEVLTEEEKKKLEEQMKELEGLDAEELKKVEATVLGELLQVRFTSGMINEEEAQVIKEILLEFGWEEGIKRLNDRQLQALAKDRHCFCGFVSFPAACWCL